MARLRSRLPLPDLALFPLLSSCSAAESGWRGELLSDPEELSASTVSVMPRQPILRESAPKERSSQYAQCPPGTSECPLCGWELLSDPEELLASMVSVMPRQPTLRESASREMSSQY